MENPKVYEDKFASRENELNKSIFMSESEALRKDREFDTKSSRKLVSASTHFQPNNDRLQLISSRRGSKFNTDLPNSREETNRPLSIKAAGELKLRPRGENNDKSSHQDFNSHLVKLKVEQMAFKFKSRIGTLLKEINISMIDLNRFTSLARIDDILNFLSEKIKEKLINTEINDNNVIKIRSKERELLTESELQIESLKKRMQEKENQEKTQKLKIKENHNELRELYDKVNLKEKELSIKMTELYQIKMLMKENEKLIEGLQVKNGQLEKERSQLREMVEDSNKNVSSNHRLIEEQNEQLKAEVEELRQLLEMAAEKEVRLIEFNKNMSEEVARWRQRFQQSRQKSNEKQVSSPHSDSFNERQSSKSLHHINEHPSVLKIQAQHETNKNLTKIYDLQTEVKRLNKEISSLSSYKQKYENVIELSSKQKEVNNSSNELVKIQNMKAHSVDLYKLEIEAYYNKKMEEISTQWRDKLIEMVDNYTQQQQKRKQEMEKLEEDKRALEKKIFVLANQKYMADCKVIEKESEIYHITRGNKTNKTLDLLSEQLLISSPEINPAQQRNPNPHYDHRQELPSESTKVLSKYIECQSQQ